MENISKIIKRTAKKAYKSGLFHSFVLGRDFISYKSAFGRVFSLQKGSKFYEFASGYVHEFTQYAPTFESEYQTYGDIEMAIFRPDFIETTDNPDFVLRASIQLTNP